MAKTKAAATETPKCPVSRTDFTKGSGPILVTVGDRQLVASPKEFATGSFGWYVGEKIVQMINGIPVKVQVGISMVVVGSKELPK